MSNNWKQKSHKTRKNKAVTVETTHFSGCKKGNGQNIEIQMQTNQI